MNILLFLNIYFFFRIYYYKNLKDFFCIFLLLKKYIKKLAPKIKSSCKDSCAFFRSSEELLITELSTYHVRMTSEQQNCFVLL